MEEKQDINTARPATGADESKRSRWIICFCLTIRRLFLNFLATKTCGLYPLYDCCLIAGIGEKYRDTIAFLNIAIGEIKPSSAKQIHYFGQLQHQAKDIKSVHSADYTDGIVFRKRSRPRSKRPPEGKIGVSSAI